MKAHNQNGDERTFFRLWLQNQFTERCKKNPQYSLRAFAKNLVIDPSSLSQVLSGKRNMSSVKIKNICARLEATPNELVRFGLIEKNAVNSEEQNYFQVSADTFAVISEWHHYAITELTYIKNFNSDPKWIAKKLSISVQEAKTAIERLIRLGLLVRAENGALEKTSKNFTNDSGKVDVNLGQKELQRQVIKKALTAVDECFLDEKDITSMTMAINPKNLEMARVLIKNFRRDLCSLLEEGEQTRVYHLGVQLYPVSKIEEDICLQ